LSAPAQKQTQEAEFERLVEPHRAELRAHCYRMLGSMEDAEEALQDTMLRAWRGLAGFEQRSSLRSWLYRIATNSCLRAIERRGRRVLPLEYGPADDAEGRPAAPIAESIWLEPYLGGELPEGFAAPQATVEQRESVELAFVAALQQLPPRQRAALILRDVLGYSPAEIATELGATPAAVYSALQRAHAAVERTRPEESQRRAQQALGDDKLRGLAGRYVEAWERRDVEALVGLLREEASFAMPPRPTWYRGRDSISRFLAQYPMAPGEDWRLVPTAANCQLSFALYGRSAGSDEHRLHAVHVLDLEGEGIAAIVSFMGDSMLARSGLAATLAP
jgi:RNA polymerase sigma-70 factor (ECF subfamily)